SAVSSEVVRAVAPKAGELVVDLGAGMGSATVEAVRTGASVIAVDPAPYMRWVLGLRRRWAGRAATVTVLDGAAESSAVGAARFDDSQGITLSVRSARSDPCHRAQRRRTSEWTRQSARERSNEARAPSRWAFAREETEIPGGSRLARAGQPLVQCLERRAPAV